MATGVLEVFLFTDIVGSTMLWAADPEGMRTDLAAHDEILQSVFEQRGGRVFSNAGDSFGVAFASPSAAVGAAVEAQQRIGRHPWSIDRGIAVRIGIHTGAAQQRNDNFYGPALNETARIMSVAHGGQIVVSEPIHGMVDGPTRLLGEHRLRDLRGLWSLHQVDVPGFENDHPPLTSLGDHRSTLPAQRTSLIGRDLDVDMIRDAVRSHRLVTLIGEGGAGKTRAAIEAAGRSVSSFAGGVFFVDLTKVTAGGSVVPAFVDALARAVPPERSPMQHVLTVLEGVKALVVVDNCEHVLDAIAAFVDEVLSAAPEVHVLATSRVVLEIEGEHAVPLAPLPTDSPQAPGVQLFVERALAADAALEFDETALATIATITTRLDGMPLAIELAAARMRTLTPAQILAHLDDRFRLLVGGRRRGERQRSLEGAIAWSYDLLEPEERRAFRSLAVCAGAVTLGTAARLLGCDDLAAADHLESLLNKSLLQVAVGSETERGYRLHESMRAFGRQRLDEHGELDAAHLALEAALVPPHDEIARDYLAFSDEYYDWNERTVLEVTTRRVAAAQAQDEGRDEAAAFIYITATSPEEPGAHLRMLERVEELRAHAGDLSRSARTALWAAQMSLQSFTFRLAEMLQTTGDALDEIPEDDPSRRLFLAYRLLAMTIVDPDSVISETDALLPALIDQVHRRHDYSVAFVALARSVALLSAERTDEARTAARTAVRWAEPGSGGYDSVLSALIWMEYTEGLEHGPELEAVRAAPLNQLGLMRIGIAATMASGAPVEHRASQLAALARRRPLGALMYEESLFTIPFAWLAIEEGDLARAERLLDAFATVDPGSGTAGVRALDRLLRARTGQPLGRHEMLLRFVDPAVHERLSEILPSTLAAELVYWDHRLAGVSDTGDAPGVRAESGLTGRR